MSYENETILWPLGKVKSMATIIYQTFMRYKNLLVNAARAACYLKNFYLFLKGRYDHMFADEYA